MLPYNDRIPKRGGEEDFCGCCKRNRFMIYFCCVLCLMVSTYLIFAVSIMTKRYKSDPEESKYLYPGTVPPDYYDFPSLHEPSDHDDPHIGSSSDGDNHEDSNGDNIQNHDDEPDDHYSVPPTETHDPHMDKKNSERRKAVREAFLHAYRGYESRAWGKDELKPISGGSGNWISGGMGMTIIDALDTAFIMGLDDIVQKSLSWIRANLNFNINDKISVFETTIRIVGGLVSAYDLIGDPILLQKAVEITDRLLPAFQSSTGIPYSEVNLRTGGKNHQGWTGGTALLAEFGTLQIEFRRLSHLTGNPKYDDAVTKIMDVLERHSRSDGQYPCFYYNEKDQWRGDLIKWGAWGDSFYEYLIKQYLLTGRTEERYRRLYDKAINGMYEKLIKKNSAGYTYIVEVDHGRVANKMDHLVCFSIGMLVIGAEGERRVQDLETAKQLGKTCYESYHSTASGLSPDSWRFSDTEAIIPDAVKYLLRPETVEGLFYLYRATGDEMYRDWGWEIFQAIETKTKSQYGYCTVSDVRKSNPNKIDEMHTFFLGETLKYLYLLFSPMDLIPLDHYVFNTEAHPLKIYTP